MEELLKALALLLAYQEAEHQRHRQQAALNNCGMFVRDQYGRLDFQPCEVDWRLSIALVMLGLTVLAGMAWFVFSDVQEKADGDNAYEKRLKATGCNLDSLESGHEYLCPIGLRVMVDPVSIELLKNEIEAWINDQEMSQANHRRPSFASFFSKKWRVADNKCPENKIALNN